MDNPKVVNGVVIEIPTTNPSFESGSAGWSSLTIDISEYYAPPDGTCYATRSGSSGYTSQLTGHTIAAGETYYTYGLGPEYKCRRKFRCDSC